MQEASEIDDIMTSTKTNSTEKPCKDTGKRLRRNNVGVGVVYRAICSVNGKVYIGVTSQKLSERVRDHVKLSKRSNPKYLFNRSIKKYGQENFVFSEIDTFDTIEERNKKEVKHIKEHNSFHLTGRGYNMTLGGDGSSGHVKSQEAIQKIKDARAKQMFSQETRNLWSKNRRGKKRSEETKTKISKSKIGHVVTNETREKLRVANLGKIASKETRYKTSMSMIGKNRKIISIEDMNTIVKLYKTLGLHKVRLELKKLGIFISSGRIKRNLQNIGIYRTKT
jgi:group I intron endonuclease